MLQVHESVTCPLRTVASVFSDISADPLNAIVGRCVRKHGWTEEYAREVKVEFDRFFALAAATREVLTPGIDVDTFWHEFIIHTAQYAAYCQRHAGRFVHHHPTPLTGGTPVKTDTTLELLRKHFPTFNTTIWRMNAVCSRCDPCSN